LVIKEITDINNCRATIIVNCEGRYSVEKEYNIRQISLILNDFLRKLSARREYIFVCRYYYSDKVSDIAESLGLKDGTVTRELSLMRRELREALEKEGFNI
jgi:RNA polymerase sigma-70 factor (ECF subfamily)